MSFLSNVKYFLQNLWEFKWFLWKNRWWDYTYIYIMLKYKLEADIKYYEKHSITVEADKIVYEIQEVLSILNKLINTTEIGEEERLKTQLFYDLKKNIRNWWD